jgi:antibiotic biosynthesis monooxygenase (ABM) superfamily enzyme
MPFGLDIKSLIVGILLAWFVVPWAMSLLNRPTARNAGPAA